MRLSVDEVYEIAEQIERNGAKFYRQAAGMTEPGKAQDMLQGLAAMEDEHEKTFAQLRQQVVREEEVRETVYEGDDQASQYLRAFADTQVFNINADPFDDLRGDESLEQILDKAIRREKESIIFFEGLKESMRAEEDRKRVELIIKEEVQHITILAEEMRKLREA